MAKKKEQVGVTKVIFRKFKDGEVIALFPYEILYNYECSSYVHIGQHSGADYKHVIRNTKPATKKEYNELFNEIKSVYHNTKFKVIKHIDTKTYFKAVYEFDKHLKEINK